MEQKIISYASRTKSAINILQADGFIIKGVGMIGPTVDSTKAEVKIINYASSSADTKNIIEADGFQVKGSEALGVAEPAIEKHPHVDKQKIREGITNNQKQGIITWNSMIDKLNEAGLMEKK